MKSKIGVILILGIMCFSLVSADLSCIGNICILSDDESSTINGEIIDIVSISSDNVELNIGSSYTGALAEGDSFSTDKNKIIINEILYSPKTNGISKIGFESEVEHDIPPSNPVKNDDCVDSDGGESEFEKGYIVSASTSDVAYPKYLVHTDGCFRGESYRLEEYYCDDSASSGYKSRAIDCEYGCVDGACLDDGFLEYYSEDHFSGTNKSFCYNNYCAVYNEESIIINGVNVALSCGKQFSECQHDAGGYNTTVMDIFIEGEKQRIFNDQIIDIGGKKYLIEINRQMSVIFNSDTKPFYTLDYELDCTESDGGINIFEKGKVSYPNSKYSYSDACENNLQVGEILCLNDNVPHTIQTPIRNYYYCPENTHCEDGACVRSNPGVNVREIFGFNIDSPVKVEEPVADIYNSNEENSTEVIEENVTEEVIEEENESNVEPIPESCQLGYRQNGTYCDINEAYLEQKAEDSICENNFECQSNLCIDSKCISGSWFTKMMSWFKRIF